MSDLTKILILLGVVLIVAILSTTLFLGVGYVVSLVLPLNLFQGTLLAVGATFVAAFIIAAVAIAVPMNRYADYARMEDAAWLNEDFENDIDEDDEGDEEKMEAQRPEPPNSEKTMKAGRNQPCPCGSGLKFKRCCGS